MTTSLTGLRTGRGRPLRLGMQIGRGGGGVVHLNLDDGATVIKLLKEPKVTPHNAELLRAMVDRAVPADVPDTPAVVAWPRDVVVDGYGHVVGYTMAKALGSQPHILYDLMHPRSRERIAVNLAWHTLLQLAHNSAAAFAHLHSLGIVIGDINESNILAAGCGEVTLIDCDSMQFRDRRGRKWFTAYHKPEYLAPELHGVDLHHVPRRREHDHYAMAVLFFQLLMDNWHPYSGVGGDPDTRWHQHAAAGRFAYPGKLRNFRAPPGAPPWRALPRPVQQLFVRTFALGGPDPSKRPDAAEWRDALYRAATQLRLCGGPRGHYFPRELPSCPWCEHDRRLGRAASSPSIAPSRRRFAPSSQPTVPHAGLPKAPPGPLSAHARTPPAHRIPQPSTPPPINMSTTATLPPRPSSTPPAPARRPRRRRIVAPLVALMVAAAIGSGLQDTGDSSTAGDRAATDAAAAASVIRRHLRLLDGGRVKAAYALFTPSYRRSRRGWVANRRKARPAIRIRFIGLARVSGDRASVPLVFYSRDRRRASAHDDTRCRAFRGRARLVRVHGRWRYSPRKFKTRVRPRKVCPA